MPKLRIGATLLLWIPAAALFGWGYVLDESGWTAGHGFASNILAAATSGLIGLPIAAIVVQWILRNDADLRTRRDIIRAAKRGVHDLQRAMESSGVSEVQALLQLASGTDFELSRLLWEVKTSAATDRLWIGYAVESVNRLMEHVKGNVHELELEPLKYTIVATRWRFFVDTVMLQAETEDIRVIPDWAYATVSQSLRQIQAELVVPYTQLLHEGRTVEELFLLRAADNCIPANLPELAESVSKFLKTLYAVIEATGYRAGLYDVILTMRESVRDMEIE